MSLQRPETSHQTRLGGFGQDSTFSAPGPGHEVDMLGHDIRSAVSDVIGGLRLVEMQSVDPALRGQLEGVCAASEQLARLVDDALGLLSGTRPRGAELPSNLHLHRLMEDKRKRWQLRAETQGVDFHMILSPDVPVTVQVDRLPLERILGNLISNAVKHSDGGRVRVELTRDETDSILFRVTDNGPGFSDAALARLFTPQGRPEGSRVPGTGLGLHICKRNAESIGALLEVRNLAGGGAEAELCIPRKFWSGAAPVAPLAVDADAPDLSDLKVLVADDNDTNQLLISQMLALLGAECEIAGDGVEALNWMAREDFDIALIDVEMPRLGGLDVLRAERQRQACGLTASVPMLAMTAFVMRDNREAILGAGADGIMSKPLPSVSAFGQALRDAVDLRPAFDPLDAAMPDFHAQTLRDVLEAAGPSEDATLMERVLIDLDDVARDLTLSLEKQDFTEIRRQTHILVSISASLGAPAVHRLARALNQRAVAMDVAGVRQAGAQLMERLSGLRVSLEAFWQDWGDTRDPRRAAS